MGATQDALDRLPGHGQRPPDGRAPEHRRHHRGRRRRAHRRRPARGGADQLQAGAAGLAEAGVTVVGAAVAAAAFAYASYAPLRALVAVALVGALGQGVLLAVDSSEVGRTWGSAAAAVTIGAVCYLVAGRFRVPPLVVVVPAIVPLLPGLDIYRGLALLAEGKDGVLQLASAAATALALAAGVILGQYLARPLRAGGPPPGGPALGPADGRCVPSYVAPDRRGAASGRSRLAGAARRRPGASGRRRSRRGHGRTAGRVRRRSWPYVGALVTCVRQPDLARFEGRSMRPS